MVDQIREGMLLEDFLRIEHDKFEYINGEIVIMSPTFAGHDWLIELLADLLKAVLPANSGARVSTQTTFILLDSPQWVTGSRIPDVSFYSAERWQAYISENPNWRERPLALVPDLAVEVVSENDDLREVFHKAEVYIRDRVRLVWIIDPKDQLVYIYQPNRSEIVRLRGEDLLTGGAVIPDFSLKVSQLFA